MVEDSDLRREIRWLLDEKYHGERTTSAEKDIARLKKGEHVDYLIGFVEFLGCRIDLSKKPHIPRPETEYWTQRAVEEIRKANKKSIRVLDVFSGSGCIGVAVLKHIPSATVDFAEKDKKFCEQIAINVRLNNIDPKRYKIIQSDIFVKIMEKYDYILANPPYVPEKNAKSVQKSVLQNEPLTTIFGGEDGLKYIRKFLQEAKSQPQALKQ